MWPVKSFLRVSNLLLLSTVTSSFALLIWLLQVRPSVILVQPGPTIRILDADSCLDIPRNSPAQSYATTENYPVLAASGPRQGDLFLLHPNPNGQASCLLPCPTYSSTFPHQARPVPPLPPRPPPVPPLTSFPGQALTPGLVPTASPPRGRCTHGLKTTHQGVGRRREHLLMLSCLFLSTLRFAQHKISHSPFYNR